jgi:CheY-like chemotaxis protein
MVAHVSHTPREGPHPILIVDDHADIRESLADVLAIEGYQVATAMNGREALEYLKKNPAPCLILLDLTMPVMNGWDFRKTQLQDPDLADIPVVIVSGTTHPNNAVSLRALKFYDKPVNIPDLLHTVAEHC